MNSATLGQIIKPSGSRAVADGHLPVYSVTKHAGFVPSLEYFKKRVFSRDLRGYKLVEKGDFAYATIHLDEGAIGIAPERCLISPMYTVFTADPRYVASEYLIRLLKSARSLEEYERLGQGAVHRRKSISLEALSTMSVALPTLHEQRRIAAILGQTDALRAKRRRVLAHLGALTQSLFCDLVGEDWWRAVTVAPRTNRSGGFRWVPLTAVSRLATGHTPDRKRSDYWNGDIPWISLPDIRRLDGRDAVLTDLRVTALGLQNSSAVLLPAGTVSFSRTASVGFVTKMAIPMATSQDFHNWVPTPAINGDYLMSALRFSRAHLLGASDGSIHSTIYQRVAERFHVLLPPISVQEHFARQVASVNVWRSVAERTLLAVDDLFASLQSRAFRGKL